ncbi:MAG: glycosyltransferase [Thermomicrobiales bacterium]
MNPWKIRLAGILAMASMLWCGPWLLMHLNYEDFWLSVPFAFALSLTMALTAVTCINEWLRAVPETHPVPKGEEPIVGVLVPTLGEPLSMVLRTVESIFAQDWPANRLVVIVSDDLGSPELEHEVERLQNHYPRGRIVYHRPPGRESSLRRGDAKAGNLNSAYDRLIEIEPNVGYIETRDCDDEVVEPFFLRQVVGLLLHDDALAFVQTRKTAEVSEGDPFNNLEPIFYEGMLLARHATNAVFPCGSGLVWRRNALESIGLFPTWSLVEDLMSGIEALRLGWKSAYLPIVGAQAQHAPEDIPNVYKQRGTWALDTMRIMFWLDFKGLGVRQRLQFMQMAIFYLHSFATILFMLCISVTLFTNIYPFRLEGYEAAIRFWPLVVATELFLVSLKGNRPFESVWRLREMAVGLAPIYAMASLRALFGGPDCAYRYRVTRKTDKHQWYWKETLLQTTLVLVLVAGLIYRIANTSDWSAFDAGLLYLGLLQVIPMAGFVRKSWFGLDPARELFGRRRTMLDPSHANPGD